jgi:hypothetical protein
MVGTILAHWMDRGIAVSSVHRGKCIARPFSFFYIGSTKTREEKYHMVPWALRHGSHAGCRPLRRFRTPGPGRGLAVLDVAEVGDSCVLWLPRLRVVAGRGWGGSCILGASRGEIKGAEVRSMKRRRYDDTSGLLPRNVGARLSMQVLLSGLESHPAPSCLGR